MIVFLFIIFMLTFILSLYLKATKKTKTKEYISVKNLHRYIFLNSKKRKNKFLNIKNSNYNSKIEENVENIHYSRLKKVKLNKQYKKANKTKELTYVERINKKHFIKLLKVVPIIENKINTNSKTYRSNNKECLIETVAKSYAFEILLSEQFNVFDSFEKLVKIVKVYKKEAIVLNDLIIKELLILYLKLSQDIKSIKNDIKWGSSVKYIRKKHISNACIYGIYLFNPSSTKILIDKKYNIVLATTKVIEELDNLLLNQKKLYRYIIFLSKSLI